MTTNIKCIQSCDETPCVVINGSSTGDTAIDDDAAAAIEAVFAQAHDASAIIVETDGTVFLVYPSDPDDEGAITDLLYSAESWEAAAGPDGEVDADGDAAWFSGDGKPYRWTAIRRAATVDEARDFLVRWQAAVAECAGG